MAGGREVGLDEARHEGNAHQPRVPGVEPGEVLDDVRQRPRGEEHRAAARPAARGRRLQDPGRHLDRVG